MVIYNVRYTNLSLLCSVDKNGKLLRSSWYLWPYIFITLSSIRKPYVSPPSKCDEFYCTSFQSIDCRKVYNSPDSFFIDLAEVCFGNLYALLLEVDFEVVWLKPLKMLSPCSLKDNKIRLILSAYSFNANSFFKLICLSGSLVSLSSKEP